MIDDYPDAKNTVPANRDLIIDPLIYEGDSSQSMAENPMTPNDLRRLKTIAFEHYKRTRRFIRGRALNAFDAALATLRRRDSVIRFRCNICGYFSNRLPGRISRETPSCRVCGSTVRFRAIISALAHELFNKGLSISDFPIRHDIRGVGLSDWEEYARRLPRKLNYRNTFYDASPRLDITSIPIEEENAYDFLIASEVFEHVPPPVSRAFANAYRLLRPGGFMVFSVPYKLIGDTVEHYPNLHSYQLVKGGKLLLENVTVDGRQETYDNLVFHGGQGSTLEMRVFTKAGLERCIKDAGFSNSEVCPEDPRFGVLWNGAGYSRVMIVRK